MICCICNQKGGTCKTTTTYNIAATLALEFDKKVLVVDLDGQSNITTLFDKDPDDIEKGIAEVLTKKIQIKDVIVPTFVPHLDLAPSSETLKHAEPLLFSTMGREFLLDRALKEVRDDYDYVFIDVPPNMGVLTLNAFIASNNIVIVYVSSELALDGISQVLRYIDELQGNKHININDTQLVGIHHARRQTINKLVNREIDSIIEENLQTIYRFSHVSYSTEMEKAELAHKPFLIFNSRHPIADQYRQLAKEFIDVTTQ